MTPQIVPAGEARTQMRVSNSRFIATIAPAFSVTKAREFITRIKAEFDDATHNVPAFIIGHDSSFITHCTDDGEPSGTAGRPVLAVLQGSGLGDVVVVVTRYFGGTKLGTGGLVRAYGDAVRQVLEVVRRAEKVPTNLVSITVPYHLFEQTRLLAISHGGLVRDENFAAEVVITAQFRVDGFPAFQDALRELSHGQIAGSVIEVNEQTIMPLDKG
ncbi:MAG: YigZ family protein [Candidatus Promineifilaceae bacterium]